MSNSIERIHLVVDSTRHELGPEEGVDDLEAQILEAIRSGGGFVGATLDRGQRLSLFVSSTSSIQIVASKVYPHHASADDVDEQWQTSSTTWQDRPTTLDRRCGSAKRTRAE